MLPHSVAGAPSPLGEHAALYQEVHRSERCHLAEAQGLSEVANVHGGLTHEDRKNSPRRSIATHSREEFLRFRELDDQVVYQLAAGDGSRTTRRRELSDDRSGIAITECAESTEVGSDMDKQSGRNRHSRAADQSLVTKDGLRERAPRSSIPVDERMNGLELRVRDGYLHEHREIVAGNEGDEVCDTTGDSIVVWRDEFSRPRASPPGANPHLFTPISSRVPLEPRLVPQERPMHA